MRYLIVAHLTADSPELRSWLQSARAKDTALSCVLLAPTAPPTYWKAWDVLEDLRAAEARAERARRLLDEAGIAVDRVVIGAREPMTAIEDELRKDPNFDAIVIATLPPGLSRWLRLDLIHQCSRRTGMKVVAIVAKAAAPSPDRDSAHPANERTRSGLTESAGRSAGQPDAVGTTTLVAPERAPRGESARAADLPAPDQAMDIAPTRLARTLAHTPKVAEGYWALHSQLECYSAIEPELAELVALRVACRQHFTELWQEHVRIARALGTPDVRIAALEHWAASEHVRFDDRERAVLAYVDAVCQEGGAVVETRELVERYLDESQVIALTLLIGFYRMSGSFAHGLSLGTDEPFVGWSLFHGENGEQHL